MRLPTRRGTHHPRGDERGERDGLLRRRASLRVEIAGRDRCQSMRGDARAIRRARKDRTGRRSDLTQRSTETPRSTRRSPRARTWPVLPMISTLSPLGTALTMPCIHPAPVATMVVVGGSESVPSRGGGVPFRCRRVDLECSTLGRRRFDATRTTDDTQRVATVFLLRTRSFFGRRVSQSKKGARQKSVTSSPRTRSSP